MATLWKDENKGKTYRMLCGAYASLVLGRIILIVGETETIAQQFKEAVLAKTKSPNGDANNIVAAGIENYSEAIRSRDIDEVFIDHAAVDGALIAALGLEG